VKEEEEEETVELKKTMRERNAFWYLLY